MRHDNQLASERQPGGEVDKRWWCIARQRQRVERTRGGGGVTTEAMQQPAGKQEANRGEASADRGHDERWRMRHRQTL
jgi:hypothetical protein